METPKPERLRFADRRKLQFVLPELRSGDRILDLGCGEMWLTKALRRRGFDCIGIDLRPPADIVANVKHHHFEAAAFDVVIALEMLEHENCIGEINHILHPEGRLIVSTPAPRWDWLLWIGERVGLCQPRMTPHRNLFWLEDLPLPLVRKERLFGVVQLGVYQKTP